MSSLVNTRNIKLVSLIISSLYVNNAFAEEAETNDEETINFNILDIDNNLEDTKQATWRVENVTVRNETENSSNQSTFAVQPAKEEDNRSEPQKKWEHVLPFYAQNAINLGFDLPLPFSISLVPTYIKQNVSMNDLEVKVNDHELGSYLLDLSQVDFNDPEISSGSLQLRAAAWVLPFLELSAYVGRYSAKSDLLISVPQTVLGELCGKEKPTLPGRPPNVIECDGGIEIDSFSPDLKGSNWGLNMNFVTSYNSFFVVLPLSYTWSTTDDGRTKGTSILIAPRVGRSFKVKDWGVFSPYIGVSYMDTQLTSKDTITLNEAGDTVSYKINQENSDKYASILGLNWTITKSYGFAFEANYSDGRKSLLGILRYHY
ncbi:MAG: hypothetical protein V7782_14230 [Psychromonas sp.]